MTSRAGRKSSRCDPAPAALGSVRHSARRGPNAFTLLEIILSLSILVLLAGVSIGVFWGTLAEAGTSENASRITSLLRSARADAANTGRRYRLSFDEQTSHPVVAVETDPLGEPGAFRPAAFWWADQAKLQAGVRVVLCERTGDSVFADESESASDPGRDRELKLDEVNFYPDGSSDSVRIVLANDDEEHPWAVEITLNGLDGTISTREIDTAEEPIEQEP